MHEEGRGRNTCRTLVGKPERKSPLERTTVRGRVHLKLILKRSNLRMRAEFEWLVMGANGDNDPTDFIEGGEFLGYLSNYLAKDFSPEGKSKGEK
jgi:hypothetical protein